MITIPFTDVFVFLQANIVQSLIAVFVGGLVGASQKGWDRRIIYSLISIAPAFFVTTIIYEIILNSNWRYLLAMGIVAIGAYSIKEGSKEGVKK